MVRAVLLCLSFFLCTKYIYNDDDSDDLKSAIIIENGGERDDVLFSPFIIFLNKINVEVSSNQLFSFNILHSNKT